MVEIAEMVEVHPVLEVELTRHWLHLCELKFPQALMEIKEPEK